MSEYLTSNRNYSNIKSYYFVFEKENKLDFIVQLLVVV